jgi:hypothetical protein
VLNATTMRLRWSPAIQRQLPRPPKSFFDSPAHGSTNFGSSPKTEFFDSIHPLRKLGSEFSMTGIDPKRSTHNALHHISLIRAINDVQKDGP